MTIAFDPVLDGTAIWGLVPTAIGLVIIPFPAWLYRNGNCSVEIRMTAGICSATPLAMGLGFLWKAWVPSLAPDSYLGATAMMVVLFGPIIINCLAADVFGAMRRESRELDGLEREARDDRAADNGGRRRGCGCGCRA